MRSFELFKEGLYQVKLHCEYIVTLLSLHRYLVITIELHVHHFNSQQRYNRGKNGMEKHKRMIENNVIGLDDERGFQQVEGESWTSWQMESLDVRTCLER